MRLSEMQTELLDEIDRASSAGLLSKTLFWIQQSINVVASGLPTRERERTGSITLTSGVSSYVAPADYQSIDRIVNSSGKQLEYLPIDEFFRRQNSPTATGTPEAYFFWDEKIIVFPQPTGSATLTAYYKAEMPNIYTHTHTIKHDATLAGFVQVYIDEDGIGPGEGKLLFVSPTASDAKIQIASADGHKHLFTIYHDASAATHPAWYFDEDATNEYERNFFVSPTKADTVVRSDSYRHHTHFLNFLHNPDPTTYPDASNVTVSIDEDAVDMTLRLAATLPGAASITDNEIIHSSQGACPGFFERFHPIIFRYAAMLGYLADKRWADAQNTENIANKLLMIARGNIADIGGEIRKK